MSCINVFKLSLLLLLISSGCLHHNPDAYLIMCCKKSDTVLSSDGSIFILGASSYSNYPDSIRFINLSFVLTGKNSSQIELSKAHSFILSPTSPNTNIIYPEKCFVSKRGKFIKGPDTVLINTSDHIRIGLLFQDKSYIPAGHGSLPYRLTVKQTNGDTIVNIPLRVTKK